MALQNRVDPFGELRAVAPRGGMMGNRGGRLHRADQSLGARRWASKSWICCQTAFRGRMRRIMGPSYTELFFLDEATALAAGHRPCYECRRNDALAFAAAWAAAQDLAAPPKAAEIDAALHAERLDRSRKPGRAKRVNQARLEALPFGAMVALWGETWLVTDQHLLLWSFEGYRQALRRFETPVALLTPPSIVAAMAAGYRPMVDSSFC